MGNNPGPKSDGLNEKGRTAAFAVVLSAVVLEVADTTIVNTALPAIRADLNASSMAMQWIVAGYLLTLGSLLLLGGRLGDAMGHARVFLWGVSIFIAASALCGLAQDPTQLVLARLVQGAAAAVMAPQSMAIVQLLYTPLERVSRLAWFGVIVGLAAILGPIVGGLLIQMDFFGLGWRLIFLINLPIGLLAIAAGTKVLPAAGERSSLLIDPVGAVVFAAGFGGLLYALITEDERLPMAGRLLICLVAFTFLLWGWRRARRRKALTLPSIIEPALFRIATFRWGTFAAFAFSAASIGFLLVFAVALQQGLGQTPLEVALVHIPFGAGVMLGIGLLVPRLLPRFGKWLPICGGLVMMFAIVGALHAMAGGDGGSVALLLLLACAGLGMGILSGPLSPIVVARVGSQDAGAASAAFRTAQQLGGSLGIALVGGAYFASKDGEMPAGIAGLLPAAAAVAVLLAVAIIFVACLPDEIFSKENE